MPEKVDTAAVVVPVRNEEQLLGAALAHIVLAMDHFEAGTARRATLTIVLDDCTDGSAELAAAAAATDARVTMVATNGRSVGAARALGVRVALAGIPASCLHRTWIANTDADTRVPPDWLQVFADAADDGADAVAGTVEPDPGDTNGLLHAAWRNRHTGVDGHPHVHGANLGVRASAYLAAGGFQAVPGHEDVLLVKALRACGADVRASGKLHALTSGRLHGRAREGFADYLSRLQSRLPGTGTFHGTG